MSSAIDQLKTQLRQLQDLAQSGALPEDQVQTAKAKLERQLLEAVMATAEPSSAAPSHGGLSGETAPPTKASAHMPNGTPVRAKISPKLLGSMVAFVAAVGAGGYYLVGTPQAWRVSPEGSADMPESPSASADQGSAESASAPHAMGTDQIKSMVEGLQAKLKADPNNAEGWAMLARTFSALRRFEEALPAYRQAIAQRPDDAQLYADYADALAVTQGNKLEGEPAKLIEKALSLNTNNFKTLSLAGTIAYQKQDFKQAVSLWERAVQHAPADNPALASQIQSALDDARQRVGQAAPVQKDTAPASAGASVSGTITLSKALVGKVSPDDTVFIFAKAAQGPKMPLAIVRKQVKDLPYRFDLNDAMAMSPQFKLSGFADVVVGARVSRSGNATPQAGDWSGQSGPTKVGTQGMQIEIADPVR